MKRILSIITLIIIIFTFSSCKKQTATSSDATSALSNSQSAVASTQSSSSDDNTNSSSENTPSAIQSETTAVHTHSYSANVVKPTCTMNGYTEYRCSCGDNYTENYISAKGHVEVADKKVPATATETGLTEGSHCSVCGTVLNEQKKIPKLKAITHIEKSNSSFTLINDLSEEYTCKSNKCKIENFECNITTTGNGKITLNITFDMVKTAQGEDPSKDIKIMFNLYRGDNQVDGGIIVENNDELGVSYEKVITKYLFPEGDYTMKIASCNQ